MSQLLNACAKYCCRGKYRELGMPAWSQGRGCELSGRQLGAGAVCDTGQKE